MMILPSSTGSAAAKAATSEAATAEASTGSTAEASSATKDEGREPVVIITTVPAFLLRMIPSEFDQQQHDELINRKAKANQKNKKDRKPRDLIVFGTDFLAINDGLSCFELRVERLCRRADSSVDVVDLHILDDALPGNVVALYVGQISFKPLTRCNEIATVTHSQDDDQPAPVLLRPHSIMVADVFSHTETISVFDMPHDYEDRLNAAFGLQAAETDISRVAHGGRHEPLRVANIAVAILQVHHRYVISCPHLSRDRLGKEPKQDDDHLHKETLTKLFHAILSLLAYDYCKYNEFR